MRRLTKDKFSYVFSPFVEPAYTVKPGETFIVETMDWTSDRLKTEADLPKLLESPVLKGSQPLMNPITGPIYIEGAKPGDVLVVDIKDIKVAETGSVMVLPGYGLLPYDFKEPKARIVPIRDGKVIFSDKISFPIKPFPGTIGTAPEREAISTFYNGHYGGNMDCADLTIGSRLYLPVFTKGALFGLGDVHASQGDGELITAVEVAAEVALTLNLIKGKPITRPRFETAELMGVIVGYRPFIEGMQIALRELINWLGDYGLTPEEAYMLCAMSHTFTVRVCQMYQITFPQFPPYPCALRVAISKDVLPKK